MNKTLSAKISSAQNLIITLFGVTPEELQNNPEVSQVTFLKVHKGLQELIGDSTSENSTQVETARAHLRSLREILQAQGFDTSGEIEKLPDMLQEVLSSSNIEQYLQEIGAKLKTLANNIDQSPDTVGQIVDEIIHILSQEFFSEEESRREKERRQEYKKLAEDAIASSFSKLEIPSLADGLLKLETSQQGEDDPK